MPERALLRKQYSGSNTLGVPPSWFDPGQESAYNTLNEMVQNPWVTPGDPQARSTAMNIFNDYAANPYESGYFNQRQAQAQQAIGERMNSQRRQLAERQGLSGYDGPIPAFVQSQQRMIDLMGSQATSDALMQNLFGAEELRRNAATQLMGADDQMAARQENAARRRQADINSMLSYEPLVTGVEQWEPQQFNQWLGLGGQALGGVLGNIDDWVKLFGGGANNPTDPNDHSGYTDPQNPAYNDPGALPIAAGIGGGAAVGFGAAKIADALTDEEKVTHRVIDEITNPEVFGPGGAAAAAPSAFGSAAAAATPFIGPTLTGVPWAIGSLGPLAPLATPTAATAVTSMAAATAPEIAAAAPAGAAGSAGLWGTLANPVLGVPLIGWLAGGGLAAYLLGSHFIGQGRETADRIVPYQETTDDLLQQMQDDFWRRHEEGVAAGTWSEADVDEYFNNLRSIQDQFFNFVSGVEGDERARSQARATIAGRVNTMINNTSNLFAPHFEQFAGAEALPTYGYDPYAAQQGQFDYNNYQP